MLNKIKLPSCWEEVYIEQFAEINKINLQDGFLSAQIEKFCILANIEQDDELFDEIDTDELLDSISKLHFLNHLPTIPAKTIGEFKLIDINKIKLGEYIDIDAFVNENLYDNIPKITAILYRKTKIDEWGSEIYEPYTFKLNQRSLEFEDIYVSDIFGAIQQFLDFRETILNAYKSLFNTESDDELNEEESIGLEEEEIKRINDDINREKLKKRFAWSALAYTLANEDITKMNNVFELSFIFCLNTLMMKQTLS